MNVSINPVVPAEERFTADTLALAGWYDTHPSIRRLWGIEVADGLRVIVAIDPTLDDDDILPVWLANTRLWTNELGVQTGRFVRLELTLDPSGNGIDFDAGSSLIADLCWRDATASPSDGTTDRQLPGS